MSLVKLPFGGRDKELGTTELDSAEGMIDDAQKKALFTPRNSTSGRGLEMKGVSQPPTASLIRGFSEPGPQIWRDDVQWSS